jgi:hypothetical protein
MPKRSNSSSKLMTVITSKTNTRDNRRGRAGNKEDECGVVFLNVVQELIDEVIWDTHFLAKTHKVTLEELWNTSPFTIPALPSHGGSLRNSIHHLASSSLSDMNARCQICGDEVSGTRFAAHLGKCFKKVNEHAAKRIKR